MACVRGKIDTRRHTYTRVCTHTHSHITWHRFERVTVIDINVQSDAQGRTTLLPRRDEWKVYSSRGHIFYLVLLLAPRVSISDVNNDLTARRDARNVNRGITRSV